MARLMYFILAFGLVLCARFSSQVAVDDERPAGASQAPTTETSETVPPVSCVNGRGMAGGCVERVQCIYNTTNIDLTLYGPPTYRDPCGGEHLCCPQQYIVAKPPPAANAFDSDEDMWDYDDWDDED